MTDKELLELFMTDPNSAMRAAVGQYGGLVYKIVYSKLGSVCQKEDIEETVSDIFVLLYQNSQKIDTEKGTLKAYLAAIAKHAAVRRAKQIMSRADILPLDELENVLFDSAGMTAEERDHIAQCIHKLGKPDSDIITMKYFYAMKSREIAKRLGIKTNTVDKKISRALAKLRLMLEEDTL